MYSPKINDENLIRALYKMKQKTHKPMTKLVEEAVRYYLNNFDLNYVYVSRQEYDHLLRIEKVYESLKSVK